MQLRQGGATRGIVIIAVAMVGSAMILWGWRWKGLHVSESVVQHSSLRLQTGRAQQSVSQQSSVDPCDSLPQSHGTSYGVDEYANMTRADWVQGSDLIIDGQITAVSGSEFNTPNQQVPTASPPDAEERSGLDLHNSVVVSIDTLYKGAPGHSGVVFVRTGGVSALCPDYQHHIDPEINGGVGDSIMLFAANPDAFYDEDPAPWYARLLSRVAQLNLGGESNYIPVIVGDVYVYEGSTATSSKTGETVAISVLRQEVLDDLTRGPTVPEAMPTPTALGR